MGVGVYREGVWVGGRYPYVCLNVTNIRYWLTFNKPKIMFYGFANGQPFLYIEGTNKQVINPLIHWT